MNQLSQLLITLPLLAGLAGCSAITSPRQSSSETSVQAATTVTDFKYDDYATVLATYVNDQAMVDYEGLQGDRAALDRFNAALAQTDPSTWSEADQIAFWMNAYNSLTLQSIIDQDPIRPSIKDIPGVWRIRKFEVGNQSYTLDNIEHNVLRVDFNEPRLHAAIVCAAVSCPPLRAEPYTGDQLEAQLDDQTRQFLASPHGFRIDRSEDIVYLSHIFKWFGDDWRASYGIEDQFTGNDAERAVLNFISGYLNEEDQAYLAEGTYKIKYLDYDWALNQQDPSS